MYHSVRGKVKEQVLRYLPVEYEIKVDRDLRNDNYNVVLLSIDTLRSDRFNSKLSPFLWKLAREGHLFENAFTVVPGTPPSFAAFMTSRLPNFKNYQLFEKEVTGLYGLSRFFTEDDDMLGLPQSIETMAEIFKKNRYITMGLVTNPFLRKEFHFDRGFDLFDEFEEFYYRPYPQAEYVLQRAIKMLKKTDNKNFFMWLHFMDIHYPYNTTEDAGKIISELNLKYPHQGINLSNDATKLIINKRAGECSSITNSKWQDRFITDINQDYNNAIYSLDKKLEKFFEQVKALDLYENTIFIFISDHGEEFADHGNFGHRNTIYEEMIKIQFFIHCPKRFPPKTHRSIVRNIDVLPTIIDLLDLKGSKNTMDGVSLKSLITGKTDDLDLNVYIDSNSQVGMRDKEWKFISNRLKFIPNKYELYNLIEDPHEQNNIYCKNNEKAGELFSLVKDIEGDLDKEAINPTKIDHKRGEIKDKTRKQLNALGYVQ
jgi:arylsulfatase A-like enzyme